MFFYAHICVFPTILCIAIIYERKLSYIIKELSNTFVIMDIHLSHEYKNSLLVVHLYVTFPLYPIKSNIFTIYECIYMENIYSPSRRTTRMFSLSNDQFISSDPFTFSAVQLLLYCISVFPSPQTIMNISFYPQVIFG